MERDIGQRGPQGETDRQIVFTLLHNQRLKPDGLTKKEVSIVIERATGKEREGIRKRIDKLLTNEKSPIKELVHPNNNSGRTRYEIKTNDLRGLAKLYNFLLPDAKMMYVLEGQFLSDLCAFMGDVIDYLYLWDLEDPQYGLPEELLEEWQSEDSLEFLPRLYPSKGPVHLKEKAIKYRVLEERWGIHDGLGDMLSSHESLKRFFHLIENFESYVEQECSDVDIYRPYTVLNIDFEAKSNKRYWEKLPRGLYGLERFPESNSVIGDSIRWIMDLWRERWDTVINEGFIVRRYDSDRIFKGREDVAQSYAIPVENVTEHGDSHYLVKAPESVRPIMPPFIYPQVKFRGDRYELKVDRSHLDGNQEHHNSDNSTKMMQSEEIERAWLEPDYEEWVEKWTLTLKGEVGKWENE